VIVVAITELVLEPAATTYLAVHVLLRVQTDGGPGT